MRLLTISTLAILLTAGFALAPGVPAAQDGLTPGSTSSVEQIRSGASEGRQVSLQGSVVSSSESRFFELEDDAGGRMIVVIPNHLQRELGTPKRGETIRVRGKYDHKTSIDYKRSKSADPGKTWGIRVASLERNIWTDGRNPSPADAGPVESITPPSRAAAEPSQSNTPGSNAPAAPTDLATLAVPKASVELKDRLASARRRVLDARKASDQANAAYASALYRKAAPTEIEPLLARQQAAQGELDTAVAAVSPLVEEARAAGVDESVLDVYEAGITKPNQ